MYDYLIIGRGIAGSLLAYTLLKKEKKILIADKEPINNSSNVAGGIFNPITGKRMVKTWNASVLFPFLHKFYKELQSELNQEFFYPKPIYKPFASIQEQNHWVSHSSSNDKEFVQATISTENYRTYVKNPFGGFETRWSGYVDIKKMLSLLKEYFEAKNIYVKENILPEDLIFNKEEIIWKNFTAKKVIFCEGYNVSENPFFNWLPFTYSKGEILNVKFKEFPSDIIFNKKVFILPIGNNTYRVGSTFEWTKDENPTEKGKTEILEKLRDLTDIPFEMVGHQAGIRTAVPDRRPIIGLHPQNKTLAIFNGFGTKGVSLVPYLAEHFFEYLQNGAELDPCVSIERYNSLYESL